MGTNYYARPVKTLAEIQVKKDRIQMELRMLSKNTSIELDDVIEEYFVIQENNVKDIHIGKSSGGWDFLFNLNKKQFYSTKEELIAWLKEVEIRSEYGYTCTFEEFWQDVVEDHHHNGKKTKTHRSASNNPDHYIIIDDLEFLDCEFC